MSDSFKDKSTKEKSLQILKYAISIAIMVGAIWYISKDMDFKSVAGYLGDMRWQYVLLVIPITIFSHFMRTVRWKTMLEPIMPGRGLYNMFSAVMVGYFANNVIPVPRAGEFLRPFALSRREKVSFSSLFATILLERVLDVIFLLTMFAVSFALLKDQILSAFPTDRISPAAILTVTALVILVALLAFYPPLFEFFLAKIIKPIAGKRYSKIESIYAKFKKGFSVIRNPSMYFKLFTESLAIWIIYAIPLYLLFFAFPALDSYDLGLTDSILILVVAGVSVTIAPTPGAVGVYHVLVQTSLTQIYGIDINLALAYATVAHGMSKLTEIALGGFFFSRENIKKVPTEEEMAEEMEEGVGDSRLTTP
ncbi:MAG: hypothetical protein Kapaf2KO_11690 [Candidatus Kapaibacteriales bacterium]